MTNCEHDDERDDTETARARLLTVNGDGVAGHASECHPVESVPGALLCILAVADRPGLFFGIGGTEEEATADAWLNLHETVSEAV